MCIIHKNNRERTIVCAICEAGILCLAGIFIVARQHSLQSTPRTFYLCRSMLQGLLLYTHIHTNRQSCHHIRNIVASHQSRFKGDAGQIKPRTTHRQLHPGCLPIRTLLKPVQYRCRPTLLRHEAGIGIVPEKISTCILWQIIKQSPFSPCILLHGTMII